MSKLQITINPYRGMNDATLDGVPLSPYSELSNYLQQPLLYWADELCEIAKRQINDKYELQIVGEAFDIMFLKDLVASTESLCEACEGERIRFSSPEKRFSGITQLVKKYGSSVRLENYKVKAFSDCGCITNQSLIQGVPAADAFLIVTCDEGIVNTLPESNFPQIVLLLADTTSLQRQNNGSYLWRIEKR